ncbi:uncharacterized protein METZ01_LOCUS90914, partial [marine metagenome]
VSLRNIQLNQTLTTHRPRKGNNRLKRKPSAYC